MVRVEIERIYGTNVASRKTIPTRVFSVKLDGYMVGLYHERSSLLSFTVTNLTDEEKELVVRETEGTMGVLEGSADAPPIDKAPKLPEDVDVSDF